MEQIYLAEVFVASYFGIGEDLGIQVEDVLAGLSVVDTKFICLDILEGDIVDAEGVSFFLIWKGPKIQAETSTDSGIRRRSSNCRNPSKTLTTNRKPI